MAAEAASGTGAEAPGTTRREALKRAGAATAGLALARPWMPLAQAATAPRIVVVGAHIRERALDGSADGGAHGVDDDGLRH